MRNPNGLHADGASGPMFGFAGGDIRTRVLLTSNRSRVATYLQVTEDSATSGLDRMTPEHAPDLRRSTNLRTESARTPSASRAGALHSHIHIHSQRQNYRPKAASMTSGRGWLATSRGRLEAVSASVMDGGFAETGGQR